MEEEYAEQLDNWIENENVSQKVAEHISQKTPLAGSDDNFQMFGEIDLLFAAIIKAKSGFESIIKATQGQVGRLTFMYANLQEMLAKTEPMLLEQGVLTMQFITGDPKDADKLRVTTMIAGHGGRIQFSVPFNPQWAKKDGDVGIKDAGKLATYLQRYQYRAAYGIVGEDADDDPENIPIGNVKNRERPSARRSGNGNGNIPPPPPPRGEAPPSDDDFRGHPLPPDNIDAQQNKELRELSKKMLEVKAVDNAEQIRALIVKTVNTSPEQVKAGNITRKQAQNLINTFQQAIKEATDGKENI